MKLYELIAELNGDGSVLANVAANTLTHLLDFVKSEAYCPCCGGIEHCIDYCTYSRRINNDYQSINRARKLLTMEVQ